MIFYVKIKSMSAASDFKKKTPEGDLAIRTLAMPADTNPRGDIFGGWVVSQMDLAGLSVAGKYAPHSVVTVAIESMVFLSPIRVGDFICCYAQLMKIGRTSLQVKIETWAVSADEADTNRRQVTEGIFTYVAVDAKGQSEPALKQPKR